MKPERRGVLVVGTGTWGTALSVTLAPHTPTTLLCRSLEERNRLAAEGRNTRFLQDVPFPPSLRLEHDPDRGLRDVCIVLLVVPTSRIRENARLLAPYLRGDHVVLSGSKGLEQGTLLRGSEMLEQELGSLGITRLGALSGPNLAREVAEGKPTMSVVASKNHEALEASVALPNTPTVRVYANTDVTGVELAGALKNVIAIGAGAADGLDAGQNAKAAFVTPGLAEIARLGVACGANALTFAGLAGLGDLLATVSGPTSRNRTVGAQLARGRTLDSILSGLAPQVAEGVETTKAARELAMRHGVEMPVVEQSFQVLYEGKAVREAFRDLMLRQPKDELAGYQVRL